MADFEPSAFLPEGNHVLFWDEMEIIKETFPHRWSNMAFAGRGFSHFNTPKFKPILAEVREWLADNGIEATIDEAGLMFRSDTDAVNAKLRWC